ncbi:MAG: hypothetical protein KKG14_10525 [Alphaproteobacteria bacterium]|nr:hypothetical protein [Alphaproteobacteria bacterium]
MSTIKLLYDVREPFRTRAQDVAPDQVARLDAPPGAPHPWAGRRSLGEDAEASLPLFKEVAAAMDDKKVAARVADIYGRVAWRTFRRGHPLARSTVIMMALSTLMLALALVWPRIEPALMAMLR